MLARQVLYQESYPSSSSLVTFVSPGFSTFIAFVYIHLLVYILYISY
jgi:hypothetical protein